MTNVTEVLDNESGIQYQGVNDASGGTGAYPTIGMIVGQFRRGRTDKPMTINKSNIRALLGYDPNNMDYVAVQDTLDTGVPSVQVVRVSENKKIEINCANASQSFYVSNYMLIDGVQNNHPWNDTYFSIEINGIVFNKDKSLNLYEINGISAYVELFADSSGNIYFQNIINTFLRIVLSPSLEQKKYSHIVDGNETAMMDSNGDIYVCLSPAPV